MKINVIPTLQVQSDKYRDFEQNLSSGLLLCLSLGWGIPGEFLQQVFSTQTHTSKKVEHFCVNSSLTLFLSWCLDFLFSLSRPRRRAPPAFTGRPLMRWLLPPMMPRQLSEPHLHACYRAEKHGANQKKEWKQCTLVITRFCYEILEICCYNGVKDKSGTSPALQYWKSGSCSHMWAQCHWGSPQEQRDQSCRLHSQTWRTEFTAMQVSGLHLYLNITSMWSTIQHIIVNKQTQKSKCLN